MTRAITARDPMAADPPMHPSYEDRQDAPDRVFGLLDDDDAEHQVDGVGAARCSPRAPRTPTSCTCTT